METKDKKDDMEFEDSGEDIDDVEDNKTGQD